MVSSSHEQKFCVRFCQLCSLHDEPELFYGVPIKVVKENRCIGNFDRKLCFIPHITFLKKKCFKAMNVLKVSSKTKCGADRSALMNLCRTLIRSKQHLWIGQAIIYMTSRYCSPSRYSTGFRSTQNVTNSEFICGSQWTFLGNQKLKTGSTICNQTDEENPICPVVFSTQHPVLHERKPSRIHPFGLHIKTHLENLKVDLNILEQTHFCKIPPHGISRSRKPIWI